MDYLVDMTTHVPPGTPDATVEEVKAREAAHSRELADQGHLLRLWRPPLQPGEWRTFGLFSAESPQALEEVLASMPLRVWRTDQVTPLSPHPNDPPSGSRPHPGGEGSASEFLTTFTVTVPGGTPQQKVDDAWHREAARAHELAEEGHLLRLWKLPPEPGRDRSLGLWRARDGADMQSVVASLPLTDIHWMDTETTPLSRHPSDPALVGSG